MSKPSVGDIVKLNDDLPDLDIHPSGFLYVDQVHDDLTESWDPVGELAMGQAEADEIAGKKGEWYVVGHWVLSDGSDVPGSEGETMSLGSYECEVVSTSG